MNLKRIAIVTGALIVAALVVAWVNHRENRPPAEGPRIGKPILDVQVMQDAAKLRFDTGTEHSTLRSTPKEWVVDEALDFPVQRDFLSEFLFKLTELRYERLVTRDASVFPELGVLLPSENGGKAEEKKTGTEFQILDGQGKSRFHVVFGNRREVRRDGEVVGKGGMYLRDLDDNTVYLLSGAPRVISKPTDWIQVVVLRLESKKDIKQFRINKPGKPEMVITRVGEPPEKVDFDTKVDWTLNLLPKGRKLSARAVGEAAKGLGDLFLVDVVDPNQPPEKLGRKKINTVDVETFEGVLYHFTIGSDADEEGNRYMTAEASLAPSVDKPELKKKVEEYNRVFKGRMLAIHNWVGNRILPDLDGLLEQKS